MPFYRLIPCVSFTNEECFLAFLLHLAKWRFCHGSYSCFYKFLSDWGSFPSSCSHCLEFHQYGGSSLSFLTEESGLTQPCCEYNGWNEDLISTRKQILMPKVPHPSLSSTESLFSPNTFKKKWDMSAFPFMSGKISSAQSMELLLSPNVHFVWLLQFNISSFFYGFAAIFRW